MNRLETPVAMIIFNQPEATRRVFARVAAARPSRLLLIADGARLDCPGEIERCEETKKIVSFIDWPCQVETNFLSENVGPRRRIISGISWVFSLVEEAIFLEHDCLPDPSFFLYCSELLARYRNHSQIGYISGFNPLEKDFPFRYGYYYSRVASLWGWATWRRTWQEYDEHLRAWPEIRNDGLLNLLFPDKKVVKYWTMVFDGVHDGTGPSTWDYQFFYTCWTRNFLNIVPRKNLIQYIGFGPQAENTLIVEPDLAVKEGSITLPLQHPPAITPWPSYEMQFQKRFYAHNIFRKAYRKLTM